MGRRSKKKKITGSICVKLAVVLFAIFFIISWALIVRGIDEERSRINKYIRNKDEPRNPYSPDQENPDPMFPQPDTEHHVTDPATPTEPTDPVTPTEPTKPTEPAEPNPSVPISENDNDILKRYPHYRIPEGSNVKKPIPQPTEVDPENWDWPDDHYSYNGYKEYKSTKQCKCEHAEDFDAYFERKKCIKFKSFDEDWGYWRTKYPGGFPRRLVWEGFAKAKHMSLFVQVKDREVYYLYPRKWDGEQHDWFYWIIYNLMSVLQDAVQCTKDFPDVEFPLSILTRPASFEDYPIVGWQKSIHSTDIQIPHMFMPYGLPKDTMSKRLRGPAWEKREEKIVFRGITTSEFRAKLVCRLPKWTELKALSNIGVVQRPRDSLVYNELKNNFKSDEHYRCMTNPPLVSRMSKGQQLKYKYQFNINGIGTTNRLWEILSSGSLIFQHHDPRELREFWYEFLEPGKHYVQVKTDYSDLIEKIEWAKAHDDDAKAIMEAGMQMWREVLQQKEVFCHFGRVMREYADMIKYDIKIHPKAIRADVWKHCRLMKK
ncbi:hypothetical protein PCE1_003356 [Barthelona sp. PCE]